MHFPNILLLLGLALPLPALADSAPPVRTFGDLTVDDPPHARTEDPRGRMLGDVEGSLRVGAPRRWVGPPVPLGVPLGFGTLELLRLLPGDGGVLAVYREPFARGPGEPGCAPTQMWQNCKQEARFYRTDGSVAWRLDFAERFPRTDHLVVFDTLLDGQTLYYNESCQTYAKDAGGKCAQLVAVDVSNAETKERWRSKPLLSNAPILKRGPWLFTGYGFTAEKHYMTVLDAATGKIVQTLPVPKSPEVLTLVNDVLEVLIYGSDTPLRFAVAKPGAASKRGVLRRL